MEINRDYYLNELIDRIDFKYNIKNTFLIKKIVVIYKSK